MRQAAPFHCLPLAGTCTGGEGTCPATPQMQHMANVLCKNCLGTYHSPAHLHSDKLTRCPRRSSRGLTMGSVYTFSFFLFLNSEIGTESLLLLVNVPGLGFALLPKARGKPKTKYSNSASTVTTTRTPEIQAGGLGRDVMVAFSQGCPFRR